jgi:hypothetical protein
LTQGRAAVDAFTRSDPYHINGGWERVSIHGYNKKRGTRPRSPSPVFAVENDYERTFSRSPMRSSRPITSSAKYGSSSM